MSLFAKITHNRSLILLISTSAILLMLFISLKMTIFSKNSTLSKSQYEIFSEAQILYREKKFNLAETKLQKLLKENPDHLESVVLLSKIKFFTRDFASAESILKKYLNDNENNPYALMWLGRVLTVQKDKKNEASMIFNKILKNDPENFMAHYYMGRILEEDGKYKEAIYEYQIAISSEYQLSKVHLSMGKMLLNLGMKDRAELHFEKVRTIDINQNDVSSTGMKDNKNKTNKISK